MLEGVEMDTTDMPDLESAAERNITKKEKLKNKRFDETAEEETKIRVELFQRYFAYSSPSYMYKSLNETKKLGRKQGTSKYNRKQTE